MGTEVIEKIATKHIGPSQGIRFTIRSTNSSSSLEHFADEINTSHAFVPIA